MLIMRNLAVQASTLSHVQTLGVIGKLSVNANEVKCLEMALYFLADQLNNPKSDFRFHNFCDYRFRYISNWINNSRLKIQLRSDGLNSAVWAVMDVEDIQWLALALEVGITEDVIISMAADDANYDRDMAIIYGDDIDLNGHYHDFHNYYCSIARLKYGLLVKLQNILNRHHAI
jgi:hypothetical protein